MVRGPRLRPEDANVSEGSLFFSWTAREPPQFRSVYVLCARYPVGENSRWRLTAGRHENWFKQSLLGAPSCETNPSPIGFLGCFPLVLVRKK